MEQISALLKHPGLQVLRAEIKVAREKYIANLARGLAMHTDPVDQREIDEKRGFWKGAIWALDTFPTLTAKDWDKFVAEALKESDEVA